MTDFLADMNKVLKAQGIETGGSAPPPRYWFSTGNYVLNRIISGSYFKGVPQGRVMAYVGPSGAGKSFMVGNTMRGVQLDPTAHIVVLDSENALDDEFATAIGVDVNQNYTYVPVMTINQVNKVASSVIRGYQKEYGDEHDAPKLVIFIDSLDMLMTETEVKHFSSGETKGDQGQRNKQLKAMLRTFVQAIKNSNISIVVTGQVYRNQDLKNGEGVWIVSDAIRYSLSQVVLLTKLKLKEDSIAIGIKMKCEGFKTRFTKPFQKVEIMVPYDMGMDPYSGLLEVAKNLGVLTLAGSWYTITGTETKFQGKNIAAHAETLLIKLEAMNKSFLEIAESDEEDDQIDGDKLTLRRKKKVDAEDE